jgi:hypothetical protein
MSAPGLPGDPFHLLLSDLQSDRGEMRQVRIRARTTEHVECLMRELASYAPSRAGRSIVIQLEHDSEIDLLTLLSAVETCLGANDIPSVQVVLDDRVYMLEPR